MVQEAAYLVKAKLSTVISFWLELNKCMYIHIKYGHSKYVSICTYKNCTAAWYACVTVYLYICDYTYV